MPFNLQSFYCLDVLRLHEKVGAKPESSSSSTETKSLYKHKGYDCDWNRMITPKSEQITRVQATSTIYKFLSQHFHIYTSPMDLILIPCMYHNHTARTCNLNLNYESKSYNQMWRGVVFVYDFHSCLILIYITWKSESRV